MTARIGWIEEKKKWFAKVQRKGMTYHLGYFDTLLSAETAIEEESKMITQEQSNGLRELMLALERRVATLEHDVAFLARTTYRKRDDFLDLPDLLADAEKAKKSRETDTLQAH